MEKYIHQLFNDEILKEAGSYFGVPFSDLVKVGGFENYIYGYQLKGIDYILRISHSCHRRLEEVEAELDFVNFLAIHNANVSVPVFSINQKLVEKVNCHDGSYFTISSYIKAKGESPRREIITPKFFENYGKTIGQFHRLTKEYVPGKGIKKRYTWNEDPLLVNAECYLPSKEQEIYKKFQELVKQILILPKNKDNYGLIHTDVHMGNFFVEHDELCVFDFDDTSYMYFVSDIAIALFYFIQGIHDEAQRLSTADEFMTLFMKGYKQENHLSEEDFLTINQFLKLREFVLYIVLYRSCDLETDRFAQYYTEFYRDRLLNDVPFLTLDFKKYI